MKRTSRCVLALFAMWLFHGTALAQPSLQLIITNGLNEPYGVAVDADNNYYVTDSANHRIAKYNPNSGTATNFAGVLGEIGSNNGPGVFAHFFSPQGIAAARGGLVVADSGNHLIRFITFGGAVSTLAGSTRGTNDGIGTAAQFNSPAGVAADAAGNIYVADTSNQRIRKIDPNNRVTTLATGLARPSAIAVDNVSGSIYIADTDNNSIRLVNPVTGALSLFAGSGFSSIFGSRDSLIATNALFDHPRGLLWVGGQTGLLVSDTGNHILRRITFDPTLSTFSVQRYLTNTLDAPLGMAIDASGNIPLVDLRSGSLSLIQVTAPQAPVSDPQIGVVILTTNVFGQLRTELVPVINSTFNNDVAVAVLAERGSDTFYTLDPNANFPQDPASRNTPTPYENGLLDWPHTLIDPATDGSNVTIRAISTQDGRRPSQIISARFLFKAAGPVINGKNLAGFTVDDATDGAQLWYTTDGSAPTNASPSLLYTPGSRLNIVDGTNDITFKVRAFKPGYSPSTITEKLFLFSDLQTSSIGITRDFVAGIGSTIVVPVEVKLAPGDELKSLQFRVEISPNGNAPSLSTQFRNLSITTNDFIQIPLPSTNAPISTTYTDGPKTGVTVSFIGSNTGLDFQDSGVVALLAVPIPPVAAAGNSYTISLLQPSGTSDGLQTPIPLSAFRDRTITVSNVSYIVGDTAVASWYNAGDFGNGNLNNNDVNNAFHASLGLFTPYSFTDVFDAMDAFPEDSSTSVGGDGQIRFLDWQIILQRSLRLSPDNWSRAWAAGGVRIPAAATLNSSAVSPVSRLSGTPAGKVWVRQARVEMNTVENATPGKQVNVPIYLKISSGSQVAGMQLRAVVIPQGDAPAVVEPALFNPSSVLPKPITIQGSQDGLPVNQTVTAWSLVQNPFSTPLQGSVFLGEVLFTLPGSAEAGQSYVVRVLNADGSPNLQTQYDFESLPATVWVGGKAQKPAETISDEWKLHFFGSLDNTLTTSDADPDGDGISNQEEYLAGSNPINLHLYATDWRNNAAPSSLKLHWFGETGKHYVIESSGNLKDWTAVSSEVAGRGVVEEFAAPSSSNGLQFYRARVVSIDAATR